MIAQPTIRELLPGFFLLETELDDFDVRGAVVVGAERAVVWDTLAHPLHMSGVAGAVGGLPVTVVYSHADWDHVWGTAGLPAVEEIWAHEVVAARFATDVPEKLAEKRSAQPGTWDDVELVAPTRTFADTESLDLGGVTLELHHLPGHTADHVVGWLPEWGAWLAADAVETPLPVVNDGAAVPAWIAELARWAENENVVHVVPSHGRVGGGELMLETVAYLQSLVDGNEQDPGSAAEPFYRETHERNVRAMLDAGEPRARDAT